MKIRKLIKNHIVSKNTPIKKHNSLSPTALFMRHQHMKILSPKSPLTFPCFVFVILDHFGLFRRAYAFYEIVNKLTFMVSLCFTTVSSELDADASNSSIPKMLVPSSAQLYASGFLLIFALAPVLTAHIIVCSLYI